MSSDKTNQENKIIWDINAKDWDDFMGEDGNLWHKELIAPQTEAFLDMNSGDRLLDIGCGNGLFARRMSKKGVIVTAFDFSESNIENAKKYDSTNIDYRLLDATDSEALKELSKTKYQGLVANMLFMDMPDIEVLFSYVNKLLSDKGVFVFSIQHPCFNSAYASINEDGDLTLKDYINHIISKGVAIPTQTQKQYYFHRPISYYINLGLSNGLVVNGFVEPTFSVEDEIYSKISPILIIRMSKA